MWGMRQSTPLMRAVGTPHWRGCSVLSARRQHLSLSTPHNKLCGVNRIPCLQNVSRHSGKHTHKNFANKAEASEKSCIFAAESCRSGRTGQTRNLLNPSGFRGFESLTFRNKKQGDKPCFFVSRPLADACVRKKV